MLASQLSGNWPKRRRKWKKRYEVELGLGLVSGTMVIGRHYAADAFVAELTGRVEPSMIRSPVRGLAPLIHLTSGFLLHN